MEQGDGSQTQFRYYFAQREAVESVIWLCGVRGARDKYDLMRLDASGAVSANMFDEDLPRFVLSGPVRAPHRLAGPAAWCGPLPANRPS
jgi:type III restriction enzyme